MPELVAFDLPSSTALFGLVVDEWEKGNAVALLDQRLSAGAKRSQLELIKASRLIDHFGPTLLHDGEGVEPGDALVVLTSGSTGIPSAVIHTHDSIRASVLASGARLSAQQSDHWLLCIPPSHVGGFSVFCRALHGGNPMTVHQNFDAEAVKAAAETGSTHVSLVNTALQRIDPSQFDRILLGGSSAPPDLPPNVVVTYGLTETMGGVIYDGAPLDGVDLRIIDDEIHLRGAMLFRGYRDGTEASDWLATGDLGHIEDSGKLVVDGRRGNLIITGGEKVWPHHVEEALIAHPQVDDCAVRGLADDEWGQRVVAWVVARNEIPSLSNIRDWVRQSLTNYHAPKELRIVSEIPRTALGKVDEPRLLDDAKR